MKVNIEKLIPHLTQQGINLIGKKVRIVTHDGNFHTDECVAICLIKQLAGEIELERSRDPKDHLYRDFVLDVGRKYDPKRGLFDHHQDATSDATNMLIAKHLFKGPFLEDLQIFMKEISDIDKGDTHITDRTGLNAIVNSLKGLDNAFEVAIEMLTIVIAGQLTSCLQRIEAEKVWDEMNLEVGIRFSETPIEVIPHWKELAERDRVFFQVVKTDDGAIITSRDTDNYPITEHGNQTFLHASKFFAKYEDFYLALDHARFMIRAKM